MNRQEIVALIAAVLVPVVTAIVGTLGILFQDRRARRTATGRRRAAFEDANRQVTFADAWWKAQRAVTDSSERLATANTRAQTLLDKAIGLIETVDRPTIDREQAVSLRELLLAYRMDHRSAKIIRVVFYLSLAWFLLLCLSLADQSLDQNGIEDAFWQFTAATLFGMLALTLRFWAVSADRQPSSTSRS